MLNYNPRYEEKAAALVVVVVVLEGGLSTLHQNGLQRILSAYCTVGRLT